jgi:nicotinamidase/pyrazinamidase
MAKRKVCLLCIDPQEDFVNRGGKGTLAVVGAIGDMDRLSVMVRKFGSEIDEIQMTLDSHYITHIAHPFWWKDKKGNHPAPFTLIGADSVAKGDWTATNPELQDWSKNYVDQLAANKRYPLVIWPVHCIIGSPGQCIDPSFLQAISEWETKFYAIAPRTTKGSNPFTEHYSAVKADVEHPSDPTTRLNSKLVDTLKDYDDILIAGEALSHCVANTIRDIADEFSVDQVKKFVLLQDASSNVTSFEKQGEDFVNEMVAKGMKLSSTTAFFS